MECPDDKTTHNKLIQRIRLYQFLAGINDEFDKDRRDLLLQKPLSTMEEAYASIRSEIIRHGVMNKEAPTSRSEGVGGGFASRRTGKQPVRRDDDKARLQCSHCGGSRHTKEGCFKLIGYPEWWPDNKKREAKRGAMSRSGEEIEWQEDEDKKKGKAALVRNEGKWEGTGWFLKKQRGNGLKFLG